MFRNAIFSFSKAHELIWKLGNWKFLLLPIVLSAILVVVLIVGAFVFSNYLSELSAAYLSRFFDVPEFLNWTLLLLLFVLQLGPCYVLFRSLVMLCYTPFLDRLTLKAEVLISGSTTESNSGVLESIARILWMTVITVSASIAVIVGSLVVGSVPLIGFLLSGIFFFPLQIFLGALAYIDPYLERRGFSHKASISLMWNDFRGVFVFGAIGTLITLIPVFGWFVGPTYCAVAGIIYGIQLFERQCEL